MTVENDAFVNLPFLQVINLNHNLIKTMNPKGFSHLPNLSTFYVCCNKLEELERGFFPFLQRSNPVILLNNNNISKVDLGVFEEMTASEVTIDLSNKLCAEWYFRWSLIRAS
jgi:hypothetical protein